MNLHKIMRESISIVGIIAFALVIRTFIFEPYYIPSGSMERTLLIGDYLFCTKYDYGYGKYSFLLPVDIQGRIFAKDPIRGDIIVFRNPNPSSPYKQLIKRLIGMPGDRLRITNTTIYINDIPVKKKFICTKEMNNKKYDIYAESLPNGLTYHVQYLTGTKQIHGGIDPDNTPSIIIPQDHYFFMGDNRDESSDSRFELGLVHNDYLIAKAKFIMYSFGQPMFLDHFDLGQQLTQFYRWFSSADLHRFFKGLYTYDQQQR